MKYPYPPQRILEILAEQKCLTPGETLELQKSNEGKGRHFQTRPQLVDGPFVDMRYLGNAPLLDDPETYEANFLLANQRVRGVGFCPIARNNFRSKQRIPQGWHLNVCDPNLQTDKPERNIHRALPNFQPTDFPDFIKRTAEMWHIDLGWEWSDELL